MAPHQYDRDRPYGVDIRGDERRMKFVNPYRTVGELNSVERLKLKRNPLDVADAVMNRYSKEGVGAIASVAGEQERLKWVGLIRSARGATPSCCG